MFPPPPHPPRRRCWVFRAADGECKHWERGERASSGIRAERGLALSVPPGAGPGLSLTIVRGGGSVQQHPGERPGRASTADSAGPAPRTAPGPGPAADCSFSGAPSRARQCFGLLLLRPHPQHALDLGLGALRQLSWRKKQTGGRADRCIYLLLVLTGFLSMAK